MPCLAILEALLCLLRLPSLAVSLHHVIHASYCSSETLKDLLSLPSYSTLLCSSLCRSSVIFEVLPCLTHHFFTSLPRPLLPFRSPPLSLILRPYPDLMTPFSTYSFSAVLDHRSTCCDPHTITKRPETSIQCSVSTSCTTKGYD